MPTVSGKVTDRSGNVATWSTSWTVAGTPATLRIIGMSAPAELWAQRVAEVGAAGLKARRIFCQLTSDGRDQADLIAAARAAGQLPVLSYKLPRDSQGNVRIADAIAGGLDGWATALGTYLAGLGVDVAVVFHHEPRGDLTPAQWIALNRRFAPLVRKSSRIRVGCFMNGFLLDGSQSAQDEFASFCTPELLDALDWFGIDAYQAGTSSSPDPDKTPGSRIRITRQWLDARGRQAMPLGIGEYNGHTAAAVADAGEAALSTPNLWFACVWNSTAGAFVPLDGSRLAAFKTTKADPRAQQ